MPSMTLSRHIEAPIDRVWEVLDDFGGIQTWNPGVAKSALTTDGPVGSGSERSCELKPAGVIQERITHHQPGERMTVHIYEMTKVPLKEGIADFRLSEAGGGTDVSIDYEYTPTTAGRVMGPVLRRVLARGLGGLLKGLQMEAEKKVST